MHEYKKLLRDKNIKDSGFALLQSQLGADFNLNTSFNDDENSAKDQGEIATTLNFKGIKNDQETSLMLEKGIAQTKQFEENNQRI